jgi:hypothetical protein
MGGAVSYAAAAAVKPSQTEGKEEKHSKDVDSVDWLNLPCPVKYEEIQRENIMSLKPELFEGLRFDFTKPLNQRFSLSHRCGGSLVQLFISHLVYSLMEVSSATIGDWLLAGMLVHYVVMVGLSFLFHPFCKLVVLCSNG